MKLTSHQLAATIIALFVLTLLGSPFIGVIQGTQPMFYKGVPNPNDYDDYSSYSGWREPLKTYAWNSEEMTLDTKVYISKGSYAQFQADVAEYELNGYKYPTQGQKNAGVIRFIELILLGIAFIGKSLHWSIRSLNKPDLILFNINLPKRRKKEFV